MPPNRLTCTMISLLVGVLAGEVCAAQNTHAPTPADVFRQARSSVVLIVGSASGDKVAQGSGFIVGKDRVVTNYHVIAGLTAAYVLFADGRTEPVAGVVAADADQDAAVLDVHTGTRPALALGDELNLHEGDSVLAIGAPQGLELSLTNGIISAFRNSEKKFLIQNTAPIAPGSSGGPLLDSRGRAVGVTTSLLADTPGVYFSIGIGAVKKLLKAAPTLSQSLAEWRAKEGVHTRVSADTVCSFITSKMMSAVPTVPTVCAVKDNYPFQYVLRVFSPTEVLEGKMRRAWSTALFLTAHALFFGGALNGACEFSLGDKDWYGCELEVSDAYSSEYHFHYVLWKDIGSKTLIERWIPDPSSDDWYRVWWKFLQDSKESSDSRYMSKGNAELRAQDACKDYVRVTPEVRLHLTSITCSVLFVSDSSVYVVIDFPDWLTATSVNFAEPLPETFGRAFASSSYNGAVIFRSPWSAGASPTRVYDIYPLRSIMFWWEEVNSGIREKSTAALQLALEREPGQTDHNVFSSAHEVKNTLHFRTPVIVRITPASKGQSLMDLTDGSEWSISNEAQNRCNLNEAIEVEIVAESSGTPPLIFGSAKGKRNCRLDAVFVKGW